MRAVFEIRLFYFRYHLLEMEDLNRKYTISMRDINYWSYFQLFKFTSDIETVNIHLSKAEYRRVLMSNEMPSS